MRHRMAAIMLVTALARIPHRKTIPRKATAASIALIPVRVPVPLQIQNRPIGLKVSSHLYDKMFHFESVLTADNVSK